MITFKRKKITLSLIDDYIKILVIKNFINNNFNQHNLSKSSLETLKITTYLNNILEDTYNKIFHQLKVDTLSLLILKKELKKSNSLFLQNKNMKSTINKYFLESVNIYRETPKKFKLLKLKNYPFLPFSLCTNNSPTLNAEK